MPAARALLSLALAASLTGLSAARAEPVDDAIRKLMDDAHVPGVAYAVTSHGRIVKLGSLGVANLETGTPVTDATRFEIASMSKMFAATAIRILADEGKLRLDDPVAKYFERLPEPLADIRIENLIGMSTGWPDDWDVIPWGNIFTDYDRESTLEMFRRLPIVAKPGTEFHYSSPGYAMLGMLVEKLSGQSYGAFLAERIFAKAGMTESSLVDPYAIVPQRAAGYLEEKGELRRGYYVTPYMHARADVGVLTTARDFARWLLALNAGRIVRDPERLFVSFKADDGRPLQYAYGWQTNPFHGFRAVSHTGGYRTGFSSLTIDLPGEDVSITILTNRQGSPRDPIAALLARQYLPGYELADPLHPETDGNAGETRALTEALLQLAKTGLPQPLFEQMSAAEAKEFGGYLEGLDSVRFLMRRDISKRGLVFGDRRLVRMVSVELHTPERSVVLDFYFGENGRVLTAGS